MDRLSRHLHEHLSIHSSRVLTPSHIIGHQQPVVVHNSFSFPNPTSCQYCSPCLKVMNQRILPRHRWSSAFHCHPCIHASRYNQAGHFSAHFTTVMCLSISKGLVPLTLFNRKCIAHPRNECIASSLQAHLTLPSSLSPLFCQ